MLSDVGSGWLSTAYVMLLTVENLMGAGCDTQQCFVLLWNIQEEHKVWGALSDI